MDNPPPFDLATTLPEDWRSRTLTSAKAHEWRSWYEPLAEYAWKKGDSAIHVDVIQDMARAAWDAEPYPVTHWRVEHFLGRIREILGTEWPIRKVLDDWHPESASLSPLRFGERLHGAIGELIGLDFWLEDGWRPVEPNGRAGPDWRLRRGEREVAVEVKRRQHPMRIPAYLDWAVKGQKMLPGYRWMNEFTWRWQPRFHDLSRCEQAIQWWLHSLPEIAKVVACVDRREIGTVTAIPQADMSVRGWGSGRPLDVRSTRPDIPCSIELASGTTAEYFSPGSNRTYWSAPSLGETEVKTFRESVVALAAQEARRQVGDHVICCVLWAVPEGWERAMTENWIQEQLLQLPDGLAAHPIGICPFGYIEWGRPRLLLNGPARSLTGD